MQANPTTRALVALVFTSRRGGQLYWARSVTAGNWPVRLKYRTSILIPVEAK
jgi:hypothetical protein